MSSDRESALYSSFASHIRSELKPVELSRASAALQRAAEAKRLVLSIHRSSDDGEEARRTIEDLIEDPSDLGKLKQLFCSPINLLLPDMRYDPIAAENAKENFRTRIADLQSSKITPKDSTKTPELDSIEDFEAWRDQLQTIDQSKKFSSAQAKPLNEHGFELKSEIEETVAALNRFESKFSSIIKELPEMPNVLNEEVHKKIRALTKIVSAVNEFTQLKTAIVETANSIEDGVKTVPAAKNNEIIENIICQVENLSAKCHK